MARVAWTAVLRPDKIEEYEREHAAIWPEVLQNLKDAGARNFSIYRLENRVFGYYECDGADATRAAIAEGEKALGWADAMGHLFEPEVAEHGEDYMPEIFRLD